MLHYLTPFLITTRIERVPNSYITPIVSIVSTKKKRKEQQVHRDNLITTTPFQATPIKTIPFPSPKLRVFLVLFL